MENRRQASRRVRGAAAAVLLIVAFLLVSPGAGAQKLFLKTYTMDDGIPAAQVFCGLQDSRGYMWFGTSGGLVKYDGEAFKVYTVEEGLVNQGVRSLAEKDGVLWIATEAGVSAFDGKTFRNYTAKDGLARGIVWRAVVHGGALWFGTSEGGLSRFDGKTFATYTTEQGLPSNNVFSLLSDGADLWVGTRGGGLARFDGKTFTAVGPGKGLDATEIFGLHKAGGALWVATRDKGLYKFENGAFTAVIPGVNFYSAAGKGDQLFFGTLGDGVYRFSGQTVQRYTSASGLVADRVYAILVDREDSVWFLTSEGISKLLSDKFLGYLDDKSILAIAEYGGAMWFGTLGEGLIRLKGDEQTVYTTEDGLSGDAVWSLAVWGEKLWIGTTGGLSSFDGTSFETWTSDQGLAYNTVSHILADDGSLWLSTIRGVSRFDGATLTSYSDKDGLPSVIVHATGKARGGVCFATEGGLSCFDGKAFTNLTTEDGLPSDSVYAVFEDGDHGVWVGTNNGLCRLDGNRCGRVFTRKDGLTNNFIGAIVEYKGDLWLGTNFGLTVFDGEKGLRRYSTKSGLIGNEFNVASIFIDSAGYPWFGTTRGASKYLSEHDRANRVPPPVCIESFAVNDVPRDRVQGMTLTSEENNVSFAYSGLSFKDEQNVLFQYWLKGYDEGWSKPTEERSVRYTNLVDGRYEFMVQAGNEDGYWSVKPASLAFVIQPPFWKAWWFVLLVLASVVAVTWLTVRARIDSIRRRTVELEKMVEERTLELAKVNEELKDLSLTDPLTRLRNRRFFSETIDADLARVKRAYGDRTMGRTPSVENCDLGFALVDIDRFKDVNDEHGHKAGDAVLQQISELLGACVRKSDAVVRWGGEEFLVIYRNANRGSLHEMTRRMAERIRSFDFRLPGGGTLKKTCSIGFSVFPFSGTSVELFSYEEVISLADRALYVAKNNGRDLVVGIVEGSEPIAETAKHEVKSDVRTGVNRKLLRIICDGTDLKL